jgi:serine/threonine-protein kinase
VTLYEMLTGRKPFQADTSYSVLNAHMNEAPTPPVELDPSISPQLNAIVLRAMAKLPEQRFQTAEEFRSALKALREVPAPQPAIQAAAPETPFQDWTAAPAAGPQYTAPQPPAFVPVPPPPAPPPRAAKSHRGLWIGLGAATAILALVAVAWLLPRVFSTNASQKPQTVAIDTTSPANAPVQVSPPAAQNPVPEQQPSSPPTQPKPSPSGAITHTAKAPSGEGKTPREPYVSPASAASPSTSSSETPSASAPSATPGPSPRDLRDAHDRYANLEARADAALAGVEQIRSQQQAQGLDIRGDILATMNRLHRQLDEAHQALAEKDMDTANEYMNRAEEATTRLEKFLGR